MDCALIAIGRLWGSGGISSGAMKEEAEEEREPVRSRERVEVGRRAGGGERIVLPREPA